MSKQPAKRRPQRPTRARKAAAAPKPAAASDGRPGSKQAAVIAMLRAPAGTTVAQIARAMDWQPHTVRGFLTSVVRIKLGLTLESEKQDGKGRVYRVTK